MKTRHYGVGLAIQHEDPMRCIALVWAQGSYVSCYQCKRKRPAEGSLCTQHAFKHNTYRAHVPPLAECDADCERARALRNRFAK